MEKPTRKHAEDLRAVSKLAVDATREVVDVVEDMHRTIASGPAVLGMPLKLPARLLTAPVYGIIRGVTRLVGAGIDAALTGLGPWLGESVPGPEREAVLAALNGVVGDHLCETGSALAIPMTFRRSGHPLPLDAKGLREALPDAGGKLLVMIHGSSMTDTQWTRDGHDHGAALSTDLGYTTVYLHYNSGLHVSTNGRELAVKLDALVDAWPVPVAEVSLVGHSMGGLVARSACHFAEGNGLRWRSKLRRLAFLGTPHHGSPIERGGSWLHALLGVTDYSAPIGRLARLRSAGVTDLRYGNVLDAHWQGSDRFERVGDVRRDLRLPVGVDCYAIAGTTAREPREHLPGDGLVPVDSALGQHARPDLTLDFPTAHRWIAMGTGHLDLLSHRAVYETLRGWFSEATTPAPPVTS